MKGTQPLDVVIED